MLKWSHEKYLKRSLTVSVLLLLLTAATNYMVDPYNKMENNRIGLYHSLDRQIKNQILSFDHDAILIGSSKTGRINPDDVNLYKFYNASFDAATPEEIFFYLKKYAVCEKFVLIGLDFFMFNEREFPLKLMHAWTGSGYTKVEYLLGGKVFLDSKKSVSKWFNNDKPYVIKANGQKVVHNTYVAKDYANIINGLKTGHFGNFHFSDKRMDYLKKTKKLLEDRNIDHAVFINPLQEEAYSTLQQLDSYKIFIDWKKKLKILFPDIFDWSHSKYSAKDYFMENDPFHYKPETGSLFLNEIMDQLGFRMATETKQKLKCR